MAISFVNSATGTTSVTVPTHQAGDLLIAFATNDGSTTIPTLPSGWTSIATSTTNTFGARLCYRLAVDSFTTATGFTSSQAMELVIYRTNGEGRTLAIGANSAISSVSNATITYPALTLQDITGTSWGIRFAAHKSVNTTLETPPTGYTLRANLANTISEVAAFDTNGGITSQTSTARTTGGTTAVWLAVTLEVKEVAPTLQPAWSTSASYLTYGTLSAYQGITNARITGTSSTDFSSASTDLYRLASGTKTYFELDTINWVGSSLAISLVGIGGSPSNITLQIATDVAISHPTLGSKQLSGTYAKGDTLCIALDRVNDKVWFRIKGGTWQDGTGTGDPATNTGGMTIAGFSTNQLASTGYSQDVGLRTSTNTYDMPTGYVYINGTAPIKASASITEADDAVAAANYLVPTYTTNNTTTTALTATVPAGTVAGDWLLAWVTSDVTTGTVTWPTATCNGVAMTNVSGALKGGTTAGSAGQLFKIRYTSGTSLSFSRSGGSGAHAVVVVRLDKTQINGNDPISVFATNTSNANNADLPAITTTLNNSLIMGFVAYDQGKTQTAVPSGYAELYHVDLASHDSSVTYQPQQTAGTVASQAYTLSGTTQSVAVQIAIGPYAAYVTPYGWDTTFDSSPNPTPTYSTFEGLANGKAYDGDSGTLNVRGSALFSSGKIYVEYNIISPNGHSQSNYGFIDPNTLTNFSVTNGSIVVNGDNVATFPNFYNNCAIGFAVDFTNGKFWARLNGGGWWGINGTGTDDPSVPSTGYSLPTGASFALSVFGSPFGGTTVGIRDNATIYGTPTGYSNLDGSFNVSAPSFAWSDLSVGIGSIGTLSPYMGVVDARYTTVSGNYGTASTIDTSLLFQSGSKKYFEVTVFNIDASEYSTTVNFYETNGLDADTISISANGTANFIVNNSGAVLPFTISNGDTLCFAIDRAANKGWIRLNGGTWYGWGFPATASDPTSGTSTWSILRNYGRFTVEGVSIDTAIRPSSAAFDVPAGFTFLDGTTATTGINGSASITETGDTVASTAALTVKASASISEAGDTVTSTAKLALTATASITETGDSVSAASVFGNPPQYGFDHATKTFTGSNDDSVDITLGIRFAVPKSVTITHVSFWKTADEIYNARRVAIFDSAGTQLATGLSSGEPSGVAGWVDVALDTPLALTGEGTKSSYDTYYTAAVVSRKYPATSQGLLDGIYSADGSVYFGGSLEANVNKNGRYVYSAGGAFYAQNPTFDFGNTDYGVDVRYTDAATGISGIVSITETGDTVGSTSTIAFPVISGSASITEAGDSITAASVLALKASVALSESNDTVVSVSTIAIKASSSITETGDTVASASKLALKAASAISEANDTVVSAAKLDIKASSAITETGDTVVSASVVALKASATITETGDTVTSLASLVNNGSASITEADDIESATGANTNRGAASITETNDAVTSTAVLPITGTVSVTETDDTLSSAGSLQTQGGGTASLVEASDTASSSATLSLTSAVSITETNDTASSVATLSLAGQAAVTEASDTITATATLPVKGMVVANDNDDTISGAAKVSLTASASVTESDDITSAAGTTSIKAAASLVEQDDSVTASTNGQVAGTATIIEAGDTVTSTSVISLRATVSVAEAGDTVVSVATLADYANTSITEDNDNVLATAILPIRGTIGTTEAGDTASITATIAIKASASLIEDNDNVTGEGNSYNRALVSITEAGDTVSSSSQIRIAANSNISEENDGAVSNSVLTINALSDIIENDDTVSSTSTIITITYAVVDITEEDDVVKQKVRPPTPAIRVQFAVAEDRSVTTVPEPIRTVVTLAEIKMVITPHENRKIETIKELSRTVVSERTNNNVKVAI